MSLSDSEDSQLEAEYAKIVDEVVQQLPTKKIVRANWLAAMATATAQQRNSATAATAATAATERNPIAILFLSLFFWLSTIRLLLDRMNDIDGSNGNSNGATAELR